MRIALLFVFITTLLSCSNDATKYTLSGTAKGMEDGSEVMIYTIENNQPKIIDTLVIKGGTFSGTFNNAEEPVLQYMVVNNSSIMFFPGTEDLKATVYKDSIQASFVTGNVQNEVYREYVNKMRDFNERRNQYAADFQKARGLQDQDKIQQAQQNNMALTAEESTYKKEFIKNNPNSIFALMLTSELLSKKQINPIEAKKMVENFTPKIQASTMGKEVLAALNNLSNSEIGGKAPMFSAKTPEGKELSLADAMGKYTIIDFWASWCRPCRVENPNVVAVYNKYHDKGLNIISVSLDKAGQEDRWIKAIEDDKMDWYHVSNLMAWQDPIAKQYSVRSIPATFLLDENGVIIAKNLRGPALGQKISSLLD